MQVTFVAETKMFLKKLRNVFRSLGSKKCFHNNVVCACKWRNIQGNNQNKVSITMFPCLRALKSQGFMLENLKGNQNLILWVCIFFTPNELQNETLTDTCINTILNNYDRHQFQS